MTDDVDRAQLPPDTLELLEKLAGRLDDLGYGTLRGHNWIHLEFKNGRFDHGRIERHISRSELAGRDAQMP